MTTTHRYEAAYFVQPTSRRGVLLLVVLSMLTLFLMLGTAYLVVSTRSRETARAFAKLTMQSESVRIPHEQLLDYAFLRLIRGSGTTPTSSTRTSGLIPLLNLTLNSGTLSNANTTPPLPTVFESLLEDKYGSSVNGTVSEVQEVPDTQILRAIHVDIPGINLTPGSPVVDTPAGIQSTYDFAGRVVTLLGPRREPTSHRVLRAEVVNRQLDLWLDNPARRRPFISTGTTPTPIVVNGPEFTIHNSGTTPTKNEAWDGFDAENPFLTRIAPSSSSVASSQINKIGFIPPGTSTGNLSGVDAAGFPFGADNDGDGVLDGYFFDMGLPTFFSPNGDEIRIDVSALIVDLDSRFNVNTHGSLAFNTYSTGSTNFHSGWAGATLASGSVPSLVNMPLGSGYGPPEVNASWMFPTSNYTPASLNRTNIFSTNPAAGENPDMAVFAGLQEVSQIGRRPTTTRFTTGSNTFRLTNAEGRYGENTLAALSDSSSVADLITSRNSTISGSTYRLARPGIPTVDDALSRITDRCVDATAASTTNGGIPPEWWDATAEYDWSAATSSPSLPAPRGVYNSPPDLHGRMITTSTTTSTSPIPMLAFAKPEWLGTEGTDDPYELRLDRKAPRNVTLTTTGTTLLDNVFSSADLEPILRPYDRDSLQLPPRLQAVLGSVSEEARLRITTESWDTTAITGSAATTIRNWTKGAIDDPDYGSGPNYAGTDAISGLLGGEVSRGERFNLNRPFTASKPAAYLATDTYYRQRQAYFKDLFTLLVALGTPADAATAQWAANVVEFRDADSTMTPFEFDTNPANGWNVDNDATTDDGSSRGRVWGAERPEVLITETSGWEDETTGELFLMLHRPWNAKAFASGTTWIHGEPLDLELDTITSDPQPMNLLDLGRKSADRTFASGTAVYPIWRLRLVDAAGNQRFVRFDMTGSGTASDFAPSSVEATTTPRMGCDSWLCIMGNNSLMPTADVPAGDQVVSSGSSGRVVVSGSGAFRLPGITPAFGTLVRSGTVYLERLTDPRATVDNSTVNIWNNNPAESDASRYTIVDQAPISVVNRRKDPVTNQPHPAAVPSVTRRSKSLIWKNEFLAPDTTAYRLQPSSMMGGSPRPMWFSWPNRPFVSSTELLLVPTGDSLGILQTYVRPSSPTNLPALTSNAIPNAFFDAVHVPTRFSGIHTTVSATRAIAALAAAGIYSDTLSVNQLSSFREPGRVNLNTVTASDVWTAVVAGPLQWSGSAASVKTIAQANFATTPANGMHNIFALSGAITHSQSGTSAPVQDTHPLLSPLQSLNASHNIYTATRLANTATVRSNVFGLWITVRESVANDPDSIKLHRAFYIFDRSIPVAFEPGRDHNVWDAVLLRRIIQ